MAGSSSGWKGGGWTMHCPERWASCSSPISCSTGSVGSTVTSFWTPSTARRRPRPPSPAQRAALQVAPHHRARAAGWADAARARPAAGRLHRRRGGAGRAPPGRVAWSERRVGVGLGTGQPRLRRRESAPAPRSRPTLARRLAATPRRHATGWVGVPRGGQPRARRRGVAPGSELRASPRRARALPGEWLPDPDGGSRAKRERRRGAACYDGLRVTLRDELAVSPSSAVQDVYRRLLGATTTTA